MRASRPEPDTSDEPRSPDLSKRALGRWGEERAASHYRRHGYTVLDRNWRSATGELDLVVHRDGVIAFSEVKTRRDDGYGPAAAAVGVAKQRRIRRLALEWLDAHRAPRDAIRFDVVAITGVHVEVIESAF